MSDDCSNDRVGVLGDERVCWLASTGATYYVLALRTPGETSYIVTECASTNSTCKDLPGTACYGDAIVVKACMPDTAGGPDLCSEWSIMAPVEVLPYACLKGYTQHTGPLPRDNWTDTCETPCFQGAPRRLPHLPECPP
jgi:hypothetical protein